MILFLLIVTICSLSLTHSYGYDSSAPLSCSRARAARARAPPCDLQRHGWCAVAGAAYPWRAVRSFIRENQGLMRRMYGDERHIAVLRAELTGNDVQDQVMFRYTDPDKPKPKPDHRFAKDTETPRLLNHDDAILNTKFIYSEEPNLRTNELYTLPHFRQQTSTTEMSSFIENNTILEPVAVPGNNTADTNSVYMNFTITFAREEGNLTTVEESTEVENTTEAEGTTEEMGTTTETATTVEEGVGDKVVSSTPGGSGQLFQDSEQEEKVTYKRRGVNACPVKEEVVAPFWANNTRGEVLALLNFYPFEQYVHWEKCTFEHRQMYCREGCRCEQQYRLHRLLAYDPNNECRGIFSDWFKFPSCCVCKCYDMPVEFRVTSRSPRQREAPPHAPEWYRRKIGVKDREG